MPSVNKVAVRNGLIKSRLSPWAMHQHFDLEQLLLLDNSVLPDDSDCWLWTGVVKNNGYGRLRVNGKYVYAHRYSLLVFRGISAPSNMDVCHHCDNRPCINPHHLFVGTRADNMADAVMKGRQARGKRLPHTKVDDDDILQIVRLAKEGVPYKIIGEKFGIGKQRAGQIAIANGVRRNGK